MFAVLVVLITNSRNLTVISAVSSLLASDAKILYSPNGILMVAFDGHTNTLTLNEPLPSTEL